MGNLLTLSEIKVHVRQGQKRAHFYCLVANFFWNIYFFFYFFFSKQWPQFSHQHRSISSHVRCPTDLPSWEMLLHKGIALPRLYIPLSHTDVPAIKGRKTDTVLRQLNQTLCLLAELGQNRIPKDKNYHQFNFLLLNILKFSQTISSASCHAHLQFLRICGCKKYDFLSLCNNKGIHY